MNISTNKLAEYAALQEQLKDIKAQEAEMRIALCDELLEGKGEGTHSFNIGGFTVKAVKKSTTTIDKDLLKHLYDDFSADERACFAFNPSFQKSKYKLLADTSLVNQVLETKPAMPSLTVTIEE